MRLPLSTAEATGWVVTADIGMLNPANLDALAADFSQDAIRRALRMAINVQAVPGASVSVFLPGPGQTVAGPLLGSGGIEGHRIGLRYSPPGDPSASDPNVLDTRPVLWFTFAWSDPAAASAVKAAVQAHQAAGRLQWAGPGAILGRRPAADVQPIIDALATAGITVPTYTDQDRSALSDDAWHAHQFDLWWYGLTMIRYHVPADSELATTTAPPLAVVGSGIKVSFAAQGRLPGQPFDTERAWINPGFVLSQQLDATDRARAEQLGLVRPAEPAWLVGRLPDSAAAIRPWIAIGNDDQGWRVFLPAPEQVATGFSFITSDRLYLAHGGTDATLTISGGGMPAGETVQDIWPPGEHEVIPNQDLRPSHPPFRTPGPRETPPLKLRVVVAGDTARTLVFEQDEVDIIRQEFVFHFNWTLAATGQYYYQHGQAAAVPSDAHVPSGDRPHFRVTQPTGLPFRMSTPARSHLRFLTGDELSAHDARVPESARPKYKRSLLDVTWRSWIDRLEAAYRVLRANVLANYQGLQVPAHISHLVDLYADALGSSPDLAAAIPDGLQVSSGWRPPQHNEALDGSAFTSFHQSGLALDVQPRGAGGPENRRPLALAILHHVATGMLGSAPADLRTAMLELGGRLFVFGNYKDEYRDWEVRESSDGVTKTYRIARVVSGLEQDAMIAELAAGEETDLVASGGLRRDLIEMFVREELGQDPTTTTPNWSAMIGQNRYMDLYWFGLHRASHVHVDFYRT